MRVNDHGAPPPKQITRPLQFKRGSAEAFRKKNPVLLYGEPAFEKDDELSSYKMKIGDGKTPYNKLPYIGDHSKPKDGKSAYELWIDAGNEGSIDDFLDSLVGDSTYEIWIKEGYQGSEQDFLDWLRTTTWGEIPESNDQIEENSDDND